MTFLFGIRETLKKIYQKYQLLLQPIGKFIFCFIFFWSLHQMLPYSEVAGRIEVIFFFSFLGMWLPMGVTFLISIFYIEIELIATLPEIAILYGIFYLLIYLFYIKFNIKSGFPLLIIPIAMFLNIPYIVPIIVGIYIGSVGIVPMILGIVVYFFSSHIRETITLVGSATESKEYIQIYQKLLQQVLYDREMLITIFVFTIVTFMLYSLLKVGNQDVQKISVYISGVSGIVLFLVSGYLLEVEMDVITIVIGFGISIFIGVILQFIKGTLDFARVEYTQFEDDEYYYYVKAVPKISVAQKEVSVKKINIRKNEKTVEEVK